MDASSELQWENLEVVNSTNSYLKDKLKKQPLSNGFFVVSGFQTGGKGQRDKSWESEAGENLLFSMYIEPKSQTIFYYNQLFSCVLKNFVQDLLPAEKVAVKWPNDILVNGEKICGILIENVFRGKEIQATIIGIGLNVNQTDFADFSRKACSLKLFQQKEFLITQLAIDLSNKLYAEYQRNPNPVELQQEYRNSLYLLKMKALYKISDEEGLYTIYGVSEEGNLLLLNNTGRFVSCKNGTVQFLE